MTKIFLSYSRKDSAVAEEIAQALRTTKGHSIVTFLDQSIKPGDDFRKATETNLRTSDAVLVVVASPYAAANSWMSYEIGAAEALHKPVMLVTSNRHSLSEFPEEFRSFPVVVFDPDKPEGVAQEIIGRLKSHAKK
jgi:nucleoside 2-deoxyribosyltransferase